MLLLKLSEPPDCVKFWTVTVETERVAAALPVRLMLPVPVLVIVKVFRTVKLAVGPRLITPDCKGAFHVRFEKLLLPFVNPLKPPLAEVKPIMFVCEPSCQVAALGKFPKLVVLVLL